jgi:ADP-ribose pyrophosphatase YjhB (NUDIX family)
MTIEALTALPRLSSNITRPGVMVVRDGAEETRELARNLVPIIGIQALGKAVELKVGETIEEAKARVVKVAGQKVNPAEFCLTKIVEKMPDKSGRHQIIFRYGTYTGQSVLVSHGGKNGLENPIYLESGIFLDTFKYHTRLAVNAFIRKKEGFLLVRRGIEPHKGDWHLPGTFLLYDQTFAGATKFILHHELGVNNIKVPDLPVACVTEDLDGDPRGPVIDVTMLWDLPEGVELKPTLENEELKFFPLDKLPPKIGFNHPEILRRLTNRR